jgi:hypothetical protein
MPENDRSIVLLAVDHVDDGPIVPINYNWWTWDAAANLHNSALGRSGNEDIEYAVLYDNLRKCMCDSPVTRAVAWQSLVQIIVRY